MDSQRKLTQKMEIQRVLLELIYKIQPMELPDSSSEHILSYDLGLDSLAKIELAGAIKKNFGVVLEDDEIAATNTLDHLTETIVRKQKHSKSVTEEQSPDKSKTFSFKKNYFADLLRVPFYGFIRGFMRHNFQLEVLGKEHIPANGSFILAANHSSHLDNPSLILASSFNFDDFVLLAAKDYFFEKKSVKLSILKYFFNLVPFDRNSEPSAMKNNIKWCQSCIEQNKKLILFPEATRSVSGKIQPFKGGCALLAYELNLPIVPAYISGAYECLPKGKSWPKKGKITVTFGKPITMDEYRNASDELRYQVYRKITHDLENQIKQLGKIN